MNERIKELEQQCWSHRVDGALVDGQLHFDTQKFAHLIVKECIDICGSMQLIGPYKDIQDATLKDASQKIKQHFDINQTKREKFIQTVEEVFKDGVDLYGRDTP